MTPLAAIGTGFVFALANAAHCAGMCGAFALEAARGPGSARGFALYGAGKAFTYVFLGALAGALGARVLAEGTTPQVVLGIAAGTVLVLAGAGRLVPAGSRPAGGAGLAGILRPALEAAGRSQSASGRFALGAVTAALPCGVVYFAALQAAAAGSAASGMLLMAAFGAGTLPALGAVGWLGRGVLARFPGPALRIAGGVLMVLMGAFALMRAVLPLLGDGTAASCCH